MRKEEFDTDSLQHYRLISRVLCAKNNLKVGDFDLLIYLNPIEYFTLDDFNSGKFIMTWDKHRHQRLKDDGWIKKVYEGRGYKGGHNKYALTQKAKLLINKLGKIIDGREDLPLIRAPKNYSQRILNTAADKYNNRKYNNGNERFYS